jgi:hypothetical protein
MPRAEFLDALSVDISDYDIIVVKSAGLCYSRIKRLHPDLVAFIVVLIDGADVAGCQLLTMLALDHELSRIPVVLPTMSLAGLTASHPSSTRPH